MKLAEQKKTARKTLCECVCTYERENRKKEAVAVVVVVEIISFRSINHLINRLICLLKKRN